MIEIQGKYNKAIVYTDNIENSSIALIQQLCNQEFIDGEKIRIMPDVHTGKGCCIGTTITLKNKKVVPNLVGVDIGCGMEAVKLAEKSIDLPMLDNAIRKYIPSGFEIREKEHSYVNDLRLEELKCLFSVNKDRAYKSLGTLGGGNHFIEVDKDNKSGDLYLVIHSGSRHLGTQVAKYYQEMAFDKLKESDIKGEIENLIKELKSQGRQKEIEKEIDKLKSKSSNYGIKKDLAYCSDYLFDDYIHDMKITQEYAVLNRKAMVDTILKEMNLHAVEEFTTIHNYIDTDAMILRKGAVSAKFEEKLIIPINMKDGALICIGKGNVDWNFSAPHGAGRLLSRSMAKESIDIEDFKRVMTEAGIYSTSVGINTLDESPMAYKPIEEIIENISDTVKIISHVKPIYNFKNSEE